MNGDSDFSPAPEELARLLPAYDVESVAARTQTATVYLGRQISPDRPVAIKVLRQRAGRGQLESESFRAYARALLRLRHPNLTGVYDLGEAGGLPFMVLEWVAGAPLSESLQGEAVDPRQAAQLIRTLCCGLEHAHRAGIVYGGLSPEKILLDSEANPKLDSFDALETSEDGTSPYRAPEAVSHGASDARSDVYSAGVLFYELLTGKLPDEQHTAPSTLSGSPVTFDEIVRRATESEPGARYASAQEMADAIESALAALAAEAAAAAIAAAPRAPDSAYEPLSVSAAPAFVPLPPLQARERGNPVRSIGLWVAYIAKAAAFVALLGGAAYFAKPHIEKFLADRDQDDSGEETTAVNEVIETAVDEEPGLEPEAETRITTEEVLASLSRLKDQLAAGSRDVFPEGAMPRGDSHLLYVGEPITWTDAAAFAEGHGAQLAVVASPDDKLWFCETFGDESGGNEFWVGAGAVPGGRWLWVDGSAWNAEGLAATPSDTDQRIALATSDTGQWMAEYAGKSMAFVLEWRNDGENPGSLLAQLRRTGEDLQSQDRESARYPIGALERGESRYMLAKGSWSWDEARQLAQDAGGRLAGATSPEEAQWYRDAFRSFLDGGGSLWLGGYKMKEGSPWRWLSREAWKASDWLEGQPGQGPSHNRLLLRGQAPGQAGWFASVDFAGEAQGMLIEWSDATADEPGEFDLDQWLAGVNRTLRIRVEPDIKKHELERKEALTDYSRSVKRILRSGSYSAFGGRGFGGNAGRLLEETLDNHLDEVREAGGIVDMPNTVPQEFRNVQTKAREDLEKLDKAHASAMQAHLQFYLQGLSKKAEDLFATGFTDDSAKLKKYIESTPDVGTFTAAIQL